jgi:hypothetical protein
MASTFARRSSLACCVAALAARWRGVRLRGAHIAVLVFEHSQLARFALLGAAAVHLFALEPFVL